jgi:ABC-type Mn2+/Zn2+ transport system ATPase subunit
MNLLTLQGVEVGYHRRHILPPVDLTIRRGTFLGIVGPNGSGKTTLVRTMLGLLPPVRGRIESSHAPRFGYVPQRSEQERSFPMTALDMVLMGRFPRRGLFRPITAEDRKAAEDALGKVGLSGMALRSLQTLSGGQRQRALIARALVTEPEILVLDEPTTGMDLVAEQSLLALVEKLRTELDLGVVMITHHLALVVNYVKEVLLVDKERQAIEHGSVEEVITPERLSALYGVPVAVEDVGGHKTVFLDARPGTSSKARSVS